MESFCIGLIVGMVVAVPAWMIGQMIAERRRVRHGCYSRCYHCGKRPFEVD